MQFIHHRRELLFGAFFGAWLGGIYALISQAINWVFLPGISVGTPGGNFTSYLLSYIIAGGVLGAISTLPENRWAGVALGGFAFALVLSLRTISSAWGMDQFGGTMIMVLLMFMPLVVLMMPVAFFIRLGVDAQQPDPSRPYLWARRYLIPAFLTLVAVGVACLSLYSKEVRDAFRYTDQMTRQGIAAVVGEKELPEPLRDVNGFRGGARGSYSLIWSDRVDTFFGPRPAGGELSQFLIIGRFENGFSFACVFSDIRPTPNCTNY